MDDLAAAGVIERYLAAAQSNDIDALVETLADDPELISPLSGRMVFRGREDLRVLLRVVYGSLRGVSWQAPVRDGNRCVVLGESRVGLAHRYDVTVFELADDGRIRRIRPFVRPWLALSVDALVVGPKMALHLGVVWRSLRRPRANR
jgi:ketosteroid isomerase-like protein